jgi:hypothetical protein
MGDIFKHICRLSFTCVFFLGVILLNAAYSFGTYAAVRSSILLLNWDSETMAHLAFGGTVFEAIAERAGIQDWIAVSVAAGLTVVYVLVAHELMRILQLRRDIRAYVAVENSMAERMARIELRSAAERLFFVSLIALVALALEIYLFLFRSAAAARNIDLPELAISMPGFGAADLAGKLVWDVAMVAAPALTAIALGLAFLYEYAKERLVDRYDALCLTMSNFIESFQQPALATTNAGPIAFATPQPVEVPREAAKTRPQAPAQPAGHEEAKLQVVGGQGRQVNMAEALANPAEFVVTENFEVWDKAYHAAVHGQSH